MAKFRWGSVDKDLEREKKSKAKARKSMKGSRTDWKKVFGAK